MLSQHCKGYSYYACGTDTESHVGDFDDYNNGGNAILAEENETAILASLHAYGIEAEVQYTTPEDTGRGLAAQAALNHTEMVIVAGGDGTVHAVAGGLIGMETTLGIIPTGTMNNLAHSLHIPETIEEACAVIAKGGRT